MKYNFLKFLFLIIVFSSFYIKTIYSKIFITIDAENEISFESGNFNPHTLNGNLLNVEFINNGKTLARAEKVVVFSSGKPSSNNHIIKVIELKNLVFKNQTIFLNDKNRNFLKENSDKLAIRIGEIKANNIPLSLKTKTEKNSNLFLKDISIDLVKTNIKSNIESVDIELNDFKNFYEKINLPSHFKIKLKNLNIKPEGDNYISQTLKKKLAELKLNKFNQSISLEILNTKVNENIKQEIQFEYELFDFFETSSFLQYSFPLSYLDVYNFDINKSENYLFLSQDLMFDEFSLKINDKGLTNYLNQNDDLKSLVSEKLYFEIEKLFSIYGNQIALPIANFIHQGGSLIVSLKPDNNENILSLALSIIQPDMLIEKFNFQTIHLK